MFPFSELPQNINQLSVIQLKPLSHHYFFVLKILSPFYVCFIYSSTHTTSFFVKAVVDTIAKLREQSDVGPYCLHYKLPKNIGR